MERRGVVTAVGGVFLVVAGFAAGGLGAAYHARQTYAEPWRKLRVEHEGTPGKPMHTRVVFENPKLAVQAVDLSLSADGAPTVANVTLRDGEELVLRYGDDKKPASLTAPDGVVARFAHDGDRTKVTFFGADGAELGSKHVTVPPQLAAFDAAPGRSGDSSSRLASLGEALSRALVPEAHAAESDDESITVTREIAVGLDVKLVGSDPKPGAAQIEASCPPFACVPVKREIDVPGTSDLGVTVTSSVPKKSLAAPGAGALDPFVTEAKAERKAAGKTLPKVARAVGAVAITSLACKSLSIASPICVKEFRSAPGVAGGAMQSLVEHQVKSDSATIDARANELFFEEEARAELDKATRVEVCVSRDGYVRVCEHVDGKPFGATPMDKISSSLELRKGVGGTLVGTFAVTQNDGADCKFSPSPRTAGPMRLTFDDEHGTVTAQLTANERGSRPNLGCSLGTANMSWTQNYSISAQQSFTKEQLSAGGKLPLHLTGTMTGSGGYTFSNCRTGDGASANCPGGKNDGYSYPVTIDGAIDRSRHQDRQWRRPGPGAAPHAGHVASPRSGEMSDPQAPIASIPRIPPAPAGGGRRKKGDGRAIIWLVLFMLGGVVGVAFHEWLPVVGELFDGLAMQIFG